MVKQFTII